MFDNSITLTIKSSNHHYAQQGSRAIMLYGFDETIKKWRACFRFYKPRSEHFDPILFVYDSHEDLHKAISDFAAKFICAREGR